LGTLLLGLLFSLGLLNLRPTLLLRLSLGLRNLRLTLLLLRLPRLRSQLLLPPGLLNLGLSLLSLYLLLMEPNLRPLPILQLPLPAQFLSLTLRPGSIILDAPGSLPFPMPGVVPALPVPVESFVGNQFVVPAVSVPVTVSIVPSPTRVNIEIEPRNTTVIHPPPVIIPGAIPSTFPIAPPPAVPEKDVHVDIGNNVHIVRIGQRDHSRRRWK